MMMHHLAVTGRRMRCVVLSLLCGALSSAVVASAPIDVLQQSAIPSPQALNAVLLGITRAGDRLVAVGERGVVLLSDDNGTSWRQGEVPVSTTLTAVQFVDDHHGWAVGHSGVVLHSEDGGEHWALQLDGKRAAQIERTAAQAESEEGSHRRDAAQLLVNDGPDKPFLTLHFSDARNGIIAGAYGLALQTRDGGQSWVSVMGRLPNDWGAHIYGIAKKERELYMVGEQGLFLRSLDGGATFEKISTPYEGSFFTLGLLPNGDLVLAGLRGTVLLSSDKGSNFQTLDNPIPVSLTATVTDGERLLLVNQAGGLLEVSADGRLRPLINAKARLTDAVAAAGAQLVGVGFSGPVMLTPVNSANFQASQASAE